MNNTFTILLFLLLAFRSANVLARSSPNPRVAKEAPLMTTTLPDVPGKEALIETVVLSPGENVPAHRHHADVFAYVLEGSIITQLGGKRRTVGRRIWQSGLQDTSGQKSTGF